MVFFVCLIWEGIIMEDDAKVIGKIIDKNKNDELKKQQEIIKNMKERGLTGAKQE